MPGRKVRKANGSGNRMPVLVRRHRQRGRLRGVAVHHEIDGQPADRLGEPCGQHVFRPNAGMDECRLVPADDEEAVIAPGDSLPAASAPLTDRRAQNRRPRAAKRLAIGTDGGRPTGRLRHDKHIPVVGRCPQLGKRQGRWMGQRHGRQPARSFVVGTGCARSSDSNTSR